MLHWCIDCSPQAFRLLVAVDWIVEGLQDLLIRISLKTWIQYVVITVPLGFVLLLLGLPLVSQVIIIFKISGPLACNVTDLFYLKEEININQRMVYVLLSSY